MRDNPRTRRALVRKPFPDALASGYKVIPGQGSLGFADKVMAVPFGESPFARFTRLHEMGHLAFTPPIIPAKVAAENGLDPQALQVCEDARVNTLLATQKGLPMTALGETESLDGFRDSITKLVGAGDAETAVKFGAETLVAFRHRNEAGIRDVLETAGLLPAIALADRALLELDPDDDGDIPFDQTIAAARVLTNGLQYGKELGESPGDLSENAKEQLSDSEMVPWGELRMEYPRLTNNHGAKVSPKYRASDTGPRLRKIGRLFTDQKIFAHRVRQPGGSLLIDGSGSMNLEPEQIQEILKIAPVAWIGLYGARSGDSGAIKVLAKDGKVCRPEDMISPGGCNVIDGPALRVLAKQSAPRIWICDGWVTGIDDIGSLANTVECSRICFAANIKRIPTVAEAIPYLRSLAK